MQQISLPDKRESLFVAGRPFLVAAWASLLQLNLSLLQVRLESCKEKSLCNKETFPGAREGLSVATWSRGLRVGEPGASGKVPDSEGEVRRSGGRVPPVGFEILAEAVEQILTDGRVPGGFEEPRPQVARRNPARPRRRLWRRDAVLRHRQGALSGRREPQNLRLAASQPRGVAGSGKSEADQGSRSDSSSSLAVPWCRSDEGPVEVAIGLEHIVEVVQGHGVASIP